MKRILAIGSIVIAIIFLACVWMAGSSLSSPLQQQIGQEPSDLAVKTVHFPSGSGALLYGWLIDGKKGHGAVVLMHGVRASRLSMLDHTRFLSRAGYSVLLFDFQASGESNGNQIGFGYIESKDAIAAVNFIRTNYPDEKIGIIGVSMGAAAATLASPPLNVDAVVLEMMYPSIDQAISNRLKVALGDWAAPLTPLLSCQFRLRLGVSSDALRPIDRVGQMTADKLFIAGESDQYTTLEESQEIYKAATAPKELWVVKGGTHEDLQKIDPNEYERRILDFFALNLLTSP